MCRLNTVEHALQLVVETSRSRFQRLWRIRQLQGHLTILGARRWSH